MLDEVENTFYYVNTHFSKFNCLVNRWISTRNSGNRKGFLSVKIVPVHSLKRLSHRPFSVRKEKESFCNHR